MAPCGMSRSLPLPDGFLLFVVRYSFVPGGRLAKLAKLFTGNCSVAITEKNADNTIARTRKSAQVVSDNTVHYYSFARLTRCVNEWYCCIVPEDHTH